MRESARAPLHIAGQEVEGMLDRLDKEVAERLKRAYAPKSQHTLGSALTAFARFAAACPERMLFQRPTHRGDLAASAHNEWTLMLFVQFLATSPSPKTKKPIGASSIRTYVSLLKGYFSFAYAFDIVESTHRLKRLIKELLDTQPISNRKKRRGLRRQHLRRLWKSLEAEGRANDDSHLTPNKVNDFALLSTAWQTLARGGEVAPRVKPREWAPDRNPTRADLVFYPEKPDSKRHCIVWLYALKKKGRPNKVPIYIEEHDGSGSDTYAALRRMVEFDPVPEEEKATTPLFRHQHEQPDGSTTSTHINVKYMSELVRRSVARLGFTNLREWGAHSARIGGATDLAATGAASEILLKAKGRWASDIATIYARLTRRTLLAASRLMQQGHGRDLEEIFPSFTQPA